MIEKSLLGISTTFSLSVLLLDNWVGSVTPLLWLVHQSSLMCKHLYDVFRWTPLAEYPGMVQLGHTADLALVFEEILY